MRFRILAIAVCSVLLALTPTATAAFDLNPTSFFDNSAVDASNVVDLR